MGVSKGSTTVAEFGMNFRTKLIVPRIEISSLVVVGVFKSNMALTRSSPTRKPLDDKKSDKDNEIFFLKP